MVHSPVVGLQGSYFYNAPLIIDAYSRLRPKYLKVLTKRMLILEYLNACDSVLLIISDTKSDPLVVSRDRDQLGLLPPAPGSLLS